MLSPPLGKVNENRTASALWGQGDDMKQRALAIALAA